MKCDGTPTLISFPYLTHISAVVSSTALPDVSKNVHGLHKNSGLHVSAYLLGLFWSRYVHNEVRLKR